METQTKVPRRLKDLTKLKKQALNNLCRFHGIHLKNGKKVKIDLLCLKLGISAACPHKLSLMPKEFEGDFSLAQIAEFESLTLERLETLSGWCKELDLCPDCHETRVTDFLLGNHVLSKDWVRKFRVSWPYKLKPMVHSIKFHPLLDSPHFCVVHAQFDPSPSDGEDEVKSMYCIVDKDLGIPYGGYCTCTPGLCHACVHMGAMLFCVADCIAYGRPLPADAVCTEDPCESLNPEGENVPPQTNINWTKSSPTKNTISEHLKYIRENTKPLQYEEAMRFRANLMTVCQTTGIYIPAIHALHPSRFNRHIHYSPPRVHELPTTAMELDEPIVYSNEITISSSQPDGGRVPPE